MSIQDCQLICRNGVLCCQEKVVCVDDCPYSVHVRGGPYNVLVYPTGDTDDGAVVHGVTPAAGTYTIATPGRYTIELDCEALNGIPCPDPLTAPTVCWEKNCLQGLLELQILEALEAICEKLILGNNSTALAEIIAELQALCDKILAGNEAQAEVLVALQAMCDKLLDALAALDALCEKLEATNESLEAICDKIEKMTAELVASLQALCDKQDAANESLESICKKLEAILDVLSTELAAILLCLLEMKNELIDQGLTLDNILTCLREQKDLPAPDITECCLGGATATTAKCTNVNKSWTEFDMEAGGWDTCTSSYGGIDLPDGSYGYADFEAIILGVGGTIVPNPNNPDQYQVCLPDDFQTCFNRACFKDRIGQLTRVCTVSLPNTTEPECANYQRTWGKYEEPIGDLLATMLDVQQQALEKQCESADDAAMSAAKLCLIEEHLNPAGPCPAEVVTLDKEAQELTIKGDVTSNYSAGQSINLQNANGEACGDATVAEGEGNVTLVEGNTVIKIVECELEEGKTPVQIVKATPVSAPVKAAIKTVKTLAVKNVVTLNVKG